MNANWNPNDGRLSVNANDLDNQNDNLGCRLSRRSLLVVGSSVLDPSLGHAANFLE